jgi:hypothetical protein
MGLSKVLEGGNNEKVVKRMPQAHVLLTAPSYINIFVVPPLYTMCISLGC